MTERAERRGEDGLGEIPPSVLAPLRKKSQLDFDIEFFASILHRAPNYVDVLRCQGELLSRKGTHAAALEIDRRLAELLPGDDVVLYNLACSLAQNDLPVEAIATLRTALQNGYDDFEHLDRDADLVPLHDDPTFVALLAEFRPRPVGKRRGKKSRRS